uniref:Uncharacterized protein n=1 Tax=Tanacetum cinerariifolium TaxID=118510 RepID=A0A6L2L7H1_TANCI|nr:hypothetical protein [Tanacetum cinerariifolium]
MKVSQNPKNIRTNWNEIKTQKLGVVQFTKKACFVCGSFSHLIKDSDFHDKRMVLKPVLKNVEKGTGQRKVRPVWNNAMRTNHQNFSIYRRNFAPTAVLTKYGIITISTARQRSSRAAVPVSAARPINIVASKPLVNVAKPRQNSLQTTHSLSRGPFYQQTTLKNRNLNNNVNAAKANSVNTAKGNKVTSAVGNQRINVVKSSACWVWRPKIKVQDYVSKNNGSYICKRFDYVDPDYRLKSMMEGMLPLGKELKVVRLLAKAPSELGIHLSKTDEGIFVGYSTTSKAFIVYNIRTRKVKENLHINILENIPMIAGGGPEWLFDLDALLKSINYAPVSAGTNSNDFAASDSHNKDKHGPSQASKNDNHERPNAESSTKTVNNARPVNTATPIYGDFPDDPLMPDLEDDWIFGDAYDDRDEGAEADYNNLETIIPISPIPSTRIHKDHPKKHIIGERRTNHKDFQNCLFACFLSRMEPKKVTQALDDESWVEAMQEELLQFKILNVWTLVDLPPRKRAIGTKWGHRQEEGIYYDEVFAPIARIEAIKLFLAYASFMDFTVYQIDVKSAFLYGTIEEGVYVSQPPGFVDPEFPDRVYKVEKALYGLHQAHRAWYETLSTYLLDNGFRRGIIDKTLFIKNIKDDILLVQVYADDIIFGSTKRSLSTEFEQLMHKRFQMSSIGELTFFLGLQVDQRKDGVFLSQNKYVSDILKKFGFSSVKSATTPMETHKPLSKDAAGTYVDVNLYRSMIGSLTYLTSFRPYIMFALCACSRFQVQPKVSHMH